MRHDLLADVFSAIKNAEMVGKKKIIVEDSKLVKNILNILKDKEYIEGYEVLMKNNYQELVVKLKTKINELKIVKPRHSFKKDGISKFKARYLPGEGIGFLFVSTPNNKVITDRELDNEGGIVIGYVY